MEFPIILISPSNQEGHWQRQIAHHHDDDHSDHVDEPGEVNVDEPVKH